MVKEKKNILDLQSILDNTPETIEVPEFGSIVVRCPTTKDKLEAKREALKITEGLTPDDAIVEQGRILALKMIKEPIISLDSYLDSDNVKISVVLDAVSKWYYLKIRGYNEKNQEQLKDFLEQMKET